MYILRVKELIFYQTVPNRNVNRQKPQNMTNFGSRFWNFPQVILQLHTKSVSFVVVNKNKYMRPVCYEY